MKILIGGDISFGRTHKGGFISYSVEGCLDSLARIPRDYSIVNLESPICSSPLTGKKAENYDGVLLYAEPQAVRHLVKAGIDYVSLGNNHALDHGLKGISETTYYLEREGVSYSGVGTDYYYPHIDEKLNLAIFSIDLVESSYKTRDLVFCREDLPLLLKGVTDTRRIYPDYIICVCIHWGLEYKIQPESYQIKLGRFLVDLGADLIVGSHPHVLQPMEIYKGKPIFYSLGNLYFTHHNKKYDYMKETHQALISVVDFQGREVRDIEDYEGYIQSGEKVLF